MIKYIKLLTVLLGVLIAFPLQAHERGWPAKRLSRVFPGAKFTSKQYSLGQNKLSLIEKYVGEKMGTEDRAPLFYIAMDKKTKEVLGRVLFIDQIGVNGNIELSVGIATDRTVYKIDLYKHSEPKGVTADKFLKQFVGKKATHRFKVGKDIKASKEITESAQAIATGVRKVMLIDYYIFGKPKSSKKKKKQRPIKEESGHEDHGHEH